MQQVSSQSNQFKFCPALDLAEYERYKSVIRYDLKGVQKTDVPFIHVESIKCLLWFQQGKTTSRDRREADSVVCPPCVRLKCDLEHQAGQSVAESPSKKVKRQQSSSRAKLSNMSPASQLKRKGSQMMERGNDKTRIKTFRHTELPLDTEQNEEMNEIVSAIEQKCPHDQEELFLEGEKHGVGLQLRDVWTTDKSREFGEFTNDQSLNSKRL